MDLHMFKKKIYVGMKFKKVKGQSEILGIYNDGFTYIIGKAGNSKKVTFEEIESAIKAIEENGYINRSWHQINFPNISSSRPCNFTTIGGVLQELGVVDYVGRGRYNRVESTK